MVSKDKLTKISPNCVLKLKIKFVFVIFKWLNIINFSKNNIKKKNKYKKKKLIFIFLKL